MAQTRSEKLRKEMQAKNLRLPHGYTVVVRKRKKSKK
jgi:hypothetical protein